MSGPKKKVPHLYHMGLTSFNKTSEMLHVNGCGFCRDRVSMKDSDERDGTRHGFGAYCHEFGISIPFAVCFGLVDGKNDGNIKYGCLNRYMRLGICPLLPTDQIIPVDAVSSSSPTQRFAPSICHQRGMCSKGAI